ncbi:hypothetical protein ACJX0J_029752, partial [Zea mays]
MSHILIYVTQMLFSITCYLHLHSLSISIIIICYLHLHSLSISIMLDAILFFCPGFNSGSNISSGCTDVPQLPEIIDFSNLFQLILDFWTEEDDYELT